MFRQSLPLLTGALVLAAAGLVHGTWSGRWSPIDLSIVSNRVYEIPETIGDWVVIDEGTYSEHELKIAELSSYIMRHYRDRGTGEVVTVLLMCGKTGPVAVHPPTVCYKGQGFEQLDAEKKHAVDTGQQGDASVGHEFLTAAFAKPDPGTHMRQRIYWAWSTNGVWQVPANPRLEFSSSPVLFKLYVTQEAHQLRRESGESAAEAFLLDALPVIRQAVSGDSTPNSNSTHEQPAAN